MKKESDMTLWQLIASRLVIHIVLALTAIFLAGFLLNQFWLPVYLSHADFVAFPHPFFLQIDLQQYEDISEEQLLESDAALLVLNEQLCVIKSVNSDKPVGYQYTVEALNDILLREEDNQMLRTDKFQNDSGETVIVMLQQNHNLLEMVHQSARLYAFSHLCVSGLIVILVCFSFVRSIYKPLQQNFSCISRNIAKTPHDTSRADPAQVSLQETQLVLHTYNTMLDEMEQMKKEREELEAQSHRLIANLSHDLKSPMTSLRGYAELLEQDDLAPEEQIRYLGYIHSNISTLNSMVELLSEQVKYQYNDYPLHLEHKDMNDFLREICASYYTIFEKRGFVMSVEIEDEPCYMDFDTVNMRRVYSNLLENIMSHNSQPTRVQIRTTLQADCYLVQIKDNGIGIAPEKRDKVFEPFYQGDESRTRQHSGLGLFVARQILEKHGATITLEAEPDYKTVFTIRFPTPPNLLL
ncbi:MAG: sensor histidine kinase [Peptococcaceae bacterium]